MAPRKIKQSKWKRKSYRSIHKKNGVIVIIPHLGSWEFFGKYTSLNFPMTSMYQPPKLSNLDPLIKKGRESSGASLVPTNKTGIKKILKALKSNELVAILPDQVPKKKVQGYIQISLVYPPTQ